VPQTAQALTKDVRTTMLSPAELNRYIFYTQATKETKVTARVELAGPASAIKVSINNLLSEEAWRLRFQSSSS